MNQPRSPKHLNRGRKLTPAEATKYQKLRSQVEEDKPEILARLKARQAIGELLASLKTARESRELSLQDVKDRTGMDRSAIARLENGLRENPTLETLYRYADAIGKKLVVKLVEK